tara:strand:+ start:2301 stop:2591 length:291 start_codon:yes stop_codon:yes gene_type:complete
MQVNKISGSTAVKLVDYESTIDVKSISIANIHSTDAALVDLYLYDSDGSYYIFKNLNLPAGVSIFLKDEDIQFAKGDKYLYIKLAAGSSTVDVIIR